ncbi:hypothetical protein CCR75_009145 [Bremia lactucae]|uniref:RxLR effector protein n=1 Tax=Bremia lactucae TaxID=4779 RepID=A0A976FM46_BRELC|nr:hypothetical protein CCR75_009145 [Bremia lactucae]
MRHHYIVLLSAIIASDAFMRTSATNDSNARVKEHLNNDNDDDERGLDVLKSIFRSKATHTNSGTWNQNLADMVHEKKSFKSVLDSMGLTKGNFEKLSDNKLLVWIQYTSAAGKKKKSRVSVLQKQLAMNDQDFHSLLYTTSRKNPAFRALLWEFEEQRGLSRSVF